MSNQSRRVSVELKEIHYKMIITVLLLIILGMFLYDEFSKPRNSVELYYWLNQDENLNSIDDDLIKAVDSDTATNLREQISRYSPSSVRHYTFLEYDGEPGSILIETTPGTRKLDILRIYQLPKELETDFKELISDR